MACTRSNRLATQPPQRFSTSVTSMRTFHEAERRNRVGVRHALAPGHAASDVLGAAAAVVALHGTDPASTVLSAVLRAPGTSPDDVVSALYDDRSLVRVLSMRRTVFAVPPELAVACLGSSLAVAKDERRKLLKMLTLNDVGDPEAHLAQAEAEALEVFAQHESVTTTLLSEASPLLATRLMNGVPTDRWATEVSFASRILLVLSSSGQVVRGRPRGGWTSTQFAWTLSERWHPALADLPDLQTSARTLAEAWLRRYGPATLDDLQWWTGWTKTLTKQAVAALDLTEVDLHGTPGVVLTDDLETGLTPDPWVALLPALDPTSMGWKHRDHLLGPHKPQVFDVNGNAGPTVWADGRIVGGWAQRDDGEVVTHLLEDVGQETVQAVGQRAVALQGLLGDVRLKARARGWTPVEKLLRA